MRVQGDPDHPYTAGFACGKVNRDADLVNSPERIATPLKRTGPKGSGQFKPITWDEALDEIDAKWKAIIAESGPLALLGYAYSAHQGLMNRGLVNGLFHALGTSRLQAGTVCDTCCEEAWNVTVGPVGGADPEDVVHSDLVISWGADLAATNVHFWALVEQHARSARPAGVVIDPRRTRSAKAADLYLPIRIGTDAASRSASCTSWCATSSPTATTSPSTRSASTASSATSCRSSRRRRRPRSPACRSPISRSSRRCTARRRPR